jgi:rubrerythrin
MSQFEYEEFQPNITVTSLDYSVCKDCGFALIEGYESLVCPTCLRPFGKSKNKKMLFILKD